MDVEDRVRTFIIENFLLGDEQALPRSQSLLDSGVVDSTGVIELVGFLEETYMIEMADEELVPENLDTIANIAAFVKRKRDGREPETPAAQ